jgi:hypothetical protein
MVSPSLLDLPTFGHARGAQAGARSLGFSNEKPLKNLKRATDKQSSAAQVHLYLPGSLTRLKLDGAAANLGRGFVLVNKNT